jgi:hypothetical protein
MTNRSRGVSFRPVSFNNFDLSSEVVRGVQAMGFAEPTPIQLRAFPIILAGKDLIGTAQTGTGKTAAFALPILTLLGHHGKFRCLVLEPTRELAAQVETAFRDYGRFTDLRATVVHGGVGYGKQREELKRGVDVVIATPGRLLDHLEQGTLHFRDVWSSMKSIACSTWDFCPMFGASSKKFRVTDKHCFFQQPCHPRSSAWPRGCCASPNWWKSVCAVPRPKPSPTPFIQWRPNKNLTCS